jgi:hypothetical protein
MSSKYPDFKITIPHDIQPGMVRVLDFAQFNLNPDGSGKDLIALF